MLHCARVHFFLGTRVHLFHVAGIMLHRTWISLFTWVHPFLLMGKAHGRRQGNCHGEYQRNSYFNHISEQVFHYFQPSCYLIIAIGHFGFIRCNYHKSIRYYRELIYKSNIYIFAMNIVPCPTLIRVD